MNRRARLKFLLLNKIRQAGTLPAEDVTLIGVEPATTQAYLNEMVKDGTISMDEEGYRAAEVKERPRSGSIGFES